MMFETVKYYGEGISGNVVQRETPYGFSRMKHKKRTKKKQFLNRLLLMILN